MSDACKPCRSSTVCVSNTFLPPSAAAAGEAGAGSACAAAERERCRRAAERSDEEGEGEEWSEAAGARRGARPSWRRRSVEAILVAGESAVVVVRVVVDGRRGSTLSEVNGPFSFVGDSSSWGGRRRPRSRDEERDGTRWAAIAPRSRARGVPDGQCHGRGVDGLRTHYSTATVNNWSSLTCPACSRNTRCVLGSFVCSLYCLRSRLRAGMKNHALYMLTGSTST